MGEIICGIDEAGRGPVIGPMVLGCAVFDKKGAEKLREINVRDSKKVLPARRRYLEPLIKQIALEYKVTSISPGEIDRMRKKITLNELEAVKMSEMICALKTKPTKIIIDAADSVEENYKKRIFACLQKLDKNFKIPEIVSEHKADVKYVEVGAASILAKVERDRQVEKLRQKHGDFGSGYPSDETTQKYIKEMMKNGSIPDFVRRSWNTVSQSALRRGAQKRLGDF